MFRRTKRRTTAALIVTTLAGGGAAANKKVIYQKTGLDLNMLGLESLQNTKEIGKILKNYGVDTEEARQLVENKWMEAIEILAKYNISSVKMAESIFVESGNLTEMMKNASKNIY